MIYTKESDSWLAHKLSNDILHKLDNERTLVFNSTWCDKEDTSVAYKWLASDPQNLVINVSLFDSHKFYLFEEEKNKRIKHISTEDICFWLLMCARYFKEYTEQDVVPVDFSNKFLCYQRKPCPTREDLYKSLYNKQGIVTIGNVQFNEINKSLPDSTVTGDTNSDSLHIINDNMSLGNLDTWNKSFLNIVSETAHDTLGRIFLSEKIFKPIIGMRPFLCYGHPGTASFLRDKGFETFDDDFGYRPHWDYNRQRIQLVSIIDSLDNLDDVYKSLVPKIKHNKNVFDDIVKKEWERINEISLAISKP